MNPTLRSRSIGARALLCLGLVALPFAGVAHAAQTKLHLTVVDWNAPPGTRIRATVRAKLKVMTVNQSIGAGGKRQTKLESLIDDFAPETLRWDVLTRPGSRASTAMDFTFPVALGGLDHGLAGEVFEIAFEIAEPGKAANQWVVARKDSTELGLFLEGEQLSHPTACIRFTKEASGYTVGIAHECTPRSFAAVQAQSSTCPTCEAKGEN